MAARLVHVLRYECSAPDVIWAALRTVGDAHGHPVVPTLRRGLHILVVGSDSDTLRAELGVDVEITLLGVLDDRDGARDMLERALHNSCGRYVEPVLPCADLHVAVVESSTRAVGTLRATLRPYTMVALLGMLDVDIATSSPPACTFSHAWRIFHEDRDDAGVHDSATCTGADDVALVYWTVGLASRAALSVEVLSLLLGGGFAPNPGGVQDRFPCWAAPGEVAIVSASARTCTVAFVGTHAVRERARLAWWRGRWYEDPVCVPFWGMVDARPRAYDLDAPLAQANAFTAAAHGDVERLEELMRQAGSGGLRLFLQPDAAGRHGMRTPLHVCAQMGHSAAVELLAHAFDGALVNVCDAHGRTPLHAAVEGVAADWVPPETAREIVRVLIEGGCNAGACDVAGALAMDSVVAQLKDTEGGARADALRAIVRLLDVAGGSESSSESSSDSEGIV